MERHMTDWGWIIAAANSVLAITFLWFAASLVQAARRPSTSVRLARLRRALGSWLLALGVFFTWIMLAWATLIDFSEPTQATLLVICAALGIGALVAWRATGDGEP